MTQSIDAAKQSLALAQAEAKAAGVPIDNTDFNFVDVSRGFQIFELRRAAEFYRASVEQSAADIAELEALNAEGAKLRIEADKLKVERSEIAERIRTARTTHAAGGDNEFVFEDSAVFDTLPAGTDSVELEEAIMEADKYVEEMKLAIEMLTIDVADMREHSVTAIVEAEQATSR